MIQPVALLAAVLCALVRSASAQDAPAANDGSTGRQPEQMVLSDALLGAPVVSESDVTLGTLDDLVVDRESGRLLAAVLAPAPSVRPDGQLVPVPADRLQVADAAGAPADQAPHRVRLLGIDAARLRDAPAIDRSRWPDRTDRTWFDRMLGHFGATASGEPTRPERLSSLVGRGVEDAEHAPVGRVSNMAVDLGERELALALVDEVDAGERVLAVPYGALRPAAPETGGPRTAAAAAAGEDFALGMSRQRLAAAPRVDRADLQRLRALARSGEAHEFFGVRRRADARPGREQPARPRGESGRSREVGGPRTQ